MIIDQLANCERYYTLGERFKKGFEHLLSTDFSQVAPGKYELDGDRLKVAVQEYESKQEADCKIEAHQRYADIQFIYAGEEMMGIDTLRDQQPTVPYNSEKDVYFFGKYDYKIRVTAGMFTVFFPQDIHMPGLSLGVASNVKKVVVKVLL